MRKRILSLLLSIVMIFSIVPTSVFANPPGSGAADDSYFKPGGQSDGTWGGKTSESGMLFSLYFAETGKISNQEYLEKEKTEELKNKLQLIGVLYTRENNQTNIQYASNLSVFGRMTVPENMEKKGFIKIDDWLNYSVPLSSVTTGFPGIYENYNDVKSKYGNDESNFKYKYMKYFTGYARELTDENYKEADFTNLERIIDEIVKRSNQSWKEYNFKDGWYKDKFDVTHYGVFKFYFEPTVRTELGSSGEAKYVMTLRDLIAYHFSNPEKTYGVVFKDGSKEYWPIYLALRSMSLSMGNAVYLDHDEPLINMYARQGGQYKKNDGFAKDSDFYNSAGVGVITGRLRDGVPEVKVVESYIKIVGYDENGNARTVKTEQPLASKAYMAEVSNNGTISVEYEKKDKNMEFKLNDIYVASTDIVPNKTGEVPVIWLEKLPFNAVTGAQLSKSPKDLDGYIANLVLENADFIENMKRYSKDEYSLETFINQALKTFTKAYYQANGSLPNVTETVEIIADYVGTTVNNVYRAMLESKVVEELLCEILKFIPDNCESIPVTADTKLDTLKVQKGDNCVWAKSDIISLPMNYWSWTNIGYLAESAKDETGNVDYEKVREYASRMDLAFKTNFTGNPNTVIIESPKSNASVATPKQEEELFEDVETVVYLRYIVTEVPKQVNILIHKRDGKEVENGREIVETPQSLDISNGFTKLVDIRTETETKYPYVKYIESWRSKEYKDNDPYIKTDGMTKTPVTDIKTDSVANLESDETVYVFWEVNEGTPVQVNILTNKTTGDKTHIGTNPLVPDGDKTPLKDMREEMPEIVPVEYYTDPEFTEDPDNIPPRKPDEKYGTDVTTPIEDLPPDETVYVFWEIEKPIDTKADVPQWRLSRYFDEVGPWTVSSMRLSLGADSGHAGSSLTPSGLYRYNMINPNGSVNDNSDTPENMYLDKWIHSKSITRGSYSVSHGHPSATVSVNGTMNLIKDVDHANLYLANWLSENTNSATELSKYDISLNTNPNNTLYPSSTVYSPDGRRLNFGIVNIDHYTHFQGIYKHVTRYCSSKNCGGHDKCKCYTIGVSATPSYNFGYHNLTATFARYVTQKHDKLVVSPVVNVENGLTTLKYQLTKPEETLNIYPEVGMLFENDRAEESLKWAIGEENRQINPVVYQTLQHKVYVSAVSSGTSVATDSRAITNAAKLGEGNKQVIYKGSAIGNAFTLHQDSSKQSAALLTVKTYALDINTKNADLKSAWGDSNYHSDKQHEVLINSLNGQTAKYDEKLLIDSPNYGNLDYTGGSITTNTNNKYELRNYSGSQVATKVPLAVGGNAIVLEHELIVRGGKLVAVRVKDTNGNTTLKNIEQLRNEGKDSKTSLYAALVNMHLIDESGNRANTVFTAFEHLTGDVLTEQQYADLLNNGRNAKDGYNSTSEVGVSVGQGWYSEDTTVLVVKEYISNLTVPSVSVTDKIALSVNGLVTPQNKAQFFNTMGKGYLYLNYDLTCKDPIYNTLPEIHSGFTFTSFPNDEYGFGEQQVNYLVPNVSITDTTRLN